MTQAATEAPTKATKTSDPENRAMIVIQRALEPLDDDARARVLRYLSDRYTPRPAPTPKAE